MRGVGMWVVVTGANIYNPACFFVSQEFFKEIIDMSEKSMNQMFTKTYGRLFTQNVRVFHELFSELRKYYSGELFCSLHWKLIMV